MNLRLAVLFFLFCHFAFGQKIIPTDSLATVPFGEEGITNLIEESVIAIETIEAELYSEGPSYELFKDFEEVSDSYKNLHSDTSLSELESMNLWALTDLNSKWEKYELDLEKQKKRMNSLAETYQSDYTKLSLLNRRWQVTKESELENAPSTIREQIDTLQSRITEARVWIEDSLSATLERYKVIAADHKEAQLYLKTIDAISSQKRLNMFSRDSRPLLTDIAREKTNPGLFQQVWTSAGNLFSDIKNFLKSRQRKVEWHIMIFVGFALLFFYFKGLLRKSGAKPSEATELAIYLVNRPIAVALVFSLFISFWYYPSPPPLITELFFLALLLPILYLANGMVKKRFRSELYFISGAYIFNLLGEFMPSYPFTQRIFILIISISAAAYAGYALYFWAKKPKDSAYKRWVYRLLIVYTIFAVLAIYANFAGSLSLARVLERTVVVNAAAGCVLIISFQIFKSLLNFFVHSRLGNQFNLIRLNGAKIQRRILFYSRIFFVYLFVDNLLSLLYLKDSVIEIWDNIMAIGRNFGEVYLSIGQVVDFALILFVFTIIANVFRAILEVEILPRVNVKKGVPMAVGMISRYTVLLLGFLMAVAAAGFSLSGVGFIIGAFGVGIGFGLQKIVGNFISGLILVIERPVRVGDVVTASETEGIITEIGVRASKIRDWDGAEVIIPNVDLITLKVTNWTFSDANRRREIFIRTEPEADPNKVIEIGKAVMKDHPDVISYPEPMVLFTGFKDFYLEFRLLFWVSDNLLQATSDVSLGIWEKLNEAGIKTPVPKQEWLNKPDKIESIEKPDNPQPED